MCITLLLIVEIEVAEVAVAVRDMRRDSVRGRLPQPRGGYLKQGAQIKPPYRPTLRDLESGAARESEWLRLG